MASYRRSEIVSGLFIVLAIVVFALFAFKVGGFDPFSVVESTSCITFLPDSGTLKDGAKVAVAGQRVGTVTSIQLVAPGEADAVWPIGAATPEWRTTGKPIVRIEFRVDHGGDLRLDVGPEGSARVMLAQDGFLSDHYLSIDPGSWEDGRPVEELGEEPVLIAGEVKKGLSEMLDRAPAILDQLSGILTDVQTKLLSDQNLALITSSLQKLDGVMDEAQVLARSASALFETGNPDGLQVQIIRPLNRTIVEGERTIVQLRERLMNETLPKLTELLEDGQGTLANADALMARLDTMLKEADPHLQTIARELATTAAKLDGRLEALQQGLLGVTSRLDGALAQAQPEILESLQTLRRALWEVEIGVRKFRANPGVILWGDDEAVLDAAPVDEAGLQRSGRARPFQQREENDARR